MKNKKLFLFSLPILLPIVTILVLLWINYFSDTFVHTNEKAISSVFGVLMMILGFYISIVLFIATDDKEKVEFIELLKQIGYVIGLGVVGLLIYWKGLTYLSFGSEIGTLDILDIVYYGNIGLAIIYTIGTIQLFKKFERKYHSTFTKISRVVIALCSIIGLMVFYIKFDVLLLIISLTLFVLSMSIRLFFMEQK